MKPITLAELTKKTRQAKGLTTAEVEAASKRGESTGVSRGYVSMIESGKVTNPSAQKLRSLAIGLGIDEDEVFAAALQIERSEEAITHKRLARIGFGYDGMPESGKRRIDSLIELLEREYERLKTEE